MSYQDVTAYVELLGMKEEAERAIELRNRTLELAAELADLRAEADLAAVALLGPPNKGLSKSQMGALLGYSKANAGRVVERVEGRAKSYE